MSIKARININNALVLISRNRVYFRIIYTCNYFHKIYVKSKRKKCYNNF